MLEKASSKSAFLVILFLLLAIVANSWGREKGISGKSPFEEGQNCLYNGDYECAKKKFSEYRKLEPDNPIGAWLIVKATYAELESKTKTGEVEKDGGYKAIIAFIDVGIAETEVEIAEGKEFDPYTGVSYIYVEEALFGLKGIFEKSHGESGSALGSACRMRDLSEKTKYQDAQHPIGLAVYELSKKRWYWKLGAMIYGFSTSRRKGLELIRDAEKGNNGPFADDIRFAIFRILTDKKVKGEDRKNDERILGISADELAVKLHDKYPRNKAVNRYLEAEKQK
jgi:hypothetical protein